MTGAVLDFVLANRGAAVLPEWLVAEDIAAGRLVRLLPDYELPEQGVFTVIPNTLHATAKVKHFISCIRTFVKS